jgi:hypothetical protein
VAVGLFELTRIRSAALHEPPIGLHAAGVVRLQFAFGAGRGERPVNAVVIDVAVIAELEPVRAIEAVAPRLGNGIARATSRSPAPLAATDARILEIQQSV